MKRACGPQEQSRNDSGIEDPAATELWVNG